MVRLPIEVEVEIGMRTFDDYNQMYWFAVILWVMELADRDIVDHIRHQWAIAPVGSL